MNFDYAFILSTLPAFLKAVGVTLQVGFIAIGTSLLVALINATILVFRTPYLQRLVGLYVELARNTPRLIQLFFTPPRATSPSITKTYEMLAVLTLICVLLFLPLSLLLSRLERRLQHGQFGS